MGWFTLQGGESDFHKEYTVDGDGNRFPLGKLNLFVDASFALAAGGYYSVSGGVLLYKSTPIWWKSTVQSVRAGSTCEAEFIAASDGLGAIERLGFLEFFAQASATLGGYPSWLTLWTDSSSAKAAAASEIPTKRTHHFVPRLHGFRAW